jgi:RNA polymerase sigma factor (sigma-70 family)
MDAEQLFQQHLQVIDHIAQSICRRNGVHEHEAEDFASDMRLKLCENDFAVIRKFQGKSSFTTYLTVVITKGFLDYRRRIWGKWTPSSRAKRLGAVAILLEKLVYRDGCTFDSACQILEQKHGVTVGRRELRSMLAQLPRRAPRRFEGDDGLDTVPSADRADALALAGEREDRLATAEQALRRALDQLPDEDRAIVRMLYFEGLSVADIARGLRLEQMRMYPRIRQLLASLRKTLGGQGISGEFLVDLNSS